MVSIVTHKRIEDFLLYNKSFVYGNYIAHYHLIKAVNQLKQDDVVLRDAYTITDEEGSCIIGFFIAGCYHLYGFTWSNAVMDHVISRIHVPRYAASCAFIGQKAIITHLFDWHKTPYTFCKDQVIYACEKITIPRGC